MMRRRRNKNFTCAVCTNAFADRAHLRAHEVSHSRLKLFTCAVCKRRYSRNTTLREHAKVHRLNVNNFICPVRYCGKHLQTRSEIIHHEKYHENSFSSENGLLPIDFSIYEGNLIMVDDNDSRPLVFQILQKALGPQKELECHSLHRKRLETLYSKNRQIIQSLQHQIDTLESQLDIEDDSSDVFDEEAQVIPIRYLRQDYPYYCGIKDCKEHFIDYFSLYHHAQQHDNVDITAVMDNQLFFPEGHYHCPVPSCEYGDGKKSESFDWMRKHFRRTHLHPTDRISHEGIDLHPAKISGTEVPNNETYMQLRYNDGNVIVGSSSQQQHISCPK